MTVERKHGTLIESSLVLANTTRMTCKYTVRDDGGQVEFSGIPGNAVHSTYPDQVEDAIEWAEDFLTLLRRL